MTLSERNEEAYKHMEAMAREINPRLPWDIGGRQMTVGFHRDGAYASLTPPKLPRPFTTRSDVPIPLGMQP